MTDEPAVAPRPAHEVALEQLEKIRAGQLWHRTSPKAYYTEISEILRNYVEKRYLIFAHEQTTSELLLSLSYSTCSNEEKERLRQVLQTADMVKFAKQQPDEQQALQTLDMSVKFVQNTKEEEITETTVPDA